MPEYTLIENSLINRISKKELKDSISQIQESVFAIWSDEAPRIIQGFTDHGFNHCIRLLEYASQILNINDGTPLSDEEMYLLIVGIYLHDIGMQCDVSKFAGIKEKAIEFGAVFNIEFTSTNANQYSLKEQIEIRNNHQYLSAAWIDYAYRTAETILGKSIKSVPDDLVFDLLDICKYHSKLNISECPLQFKLSSKGRKQLVASLVRFSDELDVAKSRVSIETVMNFSMEPENAYYWWLHHLTIIEINGNVLILKVRLNPNDYELYNSFIKKTYIDQFRNKNKSVLDILYNNNIPISISSDSEPLLYPYAGKLPEEIETVIQKIQSNLVIEKNTLTSVTKQLPNNQLKYFPRPKPYFAGRAIELEELNDGFIHSPFIFIEGGGGIGKTQLIAKFIEKLNINDRIVWYECLPTSQPDDIINGAGFEELLKGKEKTEREKFSAFKDKIEEYDLVVFLDNFQEVENVPSFKSFLLFVNEYLRKGHIIVLGRDNIVTPQLQPKRILIKGLGEDSLLHAQGLIKNSYPTLINIPKNSLKTLCDTLKGYPLAVDLAVYLLSLNVTVENILQVAVTEAKSKGSETETISNRLLNEIFTRTDASEYEREFLKLLSIFRGKVKRIEALSVIPEQILETTSRKLINRNLLEVNNDYFELHPLIREFCYGKLDNKKEIHLKAAKYYVTQRIEKWNPELEEKIYYHLSSSEQWADISDTIIQFGREFILRGYLDRLQQMITHLKKQYIFEPIFDIYEGDIAVIKGNWDIANTFFKKAMESSDEEVKVEGMIKYGEVLFRKGEVKEAQLFFEDAIIITKNNSYKKWNAWAINDLGLVKELFGGLKEALGLYNEAYQIRQELGNPVDIATSLLNIGGIKSKLGLKKEALIYYEKSLKINKDIDNRSSIATNLHNIGAIKDHLGFKKLALDFFDKSLKISEEIGEKSQIASTLNFIGVIKNNLGLKNETLDLYEKSLNIRIEIGEKRGMANSFNNIGGFLFENNDFEKACFYFVKSNALYKQIGMPEQNNPMNFLISMRKKLGKYEFKELVLKAIDLLEKDLKMLINLSEILGEPIKVEKQPDRNDPCPCGSGKKFKQCCGKVN